MKVYVVTAGEYSDYHIYRVFLDKSKAESYAKLLGGNVEPYETDDDNYDAILDSETFIECSLIWNMDKEVFDYRIRANGYDTSNYGYVYYKEKSFCYNNSASMVQMCRQMSIVEAESEETRKRYEKILYDIKAEVTYLKAECYSEKDINEILSSKYKRS